MDSEDLAAAYRSGRSIQSIADELGCARNTVRNRLIAAGVPRRNHGEHFRGVPKTPEHRAKLSAKRGANHHNWKGDEASYTAIHVWLTRNHPKTGRCEECGREGRTDYSNTSGEYRRDRADYRELCRSCHRLFDIAR